MRTMRPMWVAGAAVLACALGALAVSGAACEPKGAGDGTGVAPITGGGTGGAGGTGAPGTGGAAPAGGEILFGEIGSLTGAEATFGVSTHRGVELAVNELNAAGGIGGRKI